MSNDTVIAISRRIAAVLRLPVPHQEHMQVLHYGPRQYYKIHHDWVPEHNTHVCGPRIATFFLYLNAVNSGGGTRFPQLGLETVPAPGRAVLWYDALPTTPPSQDTRTEHEALPVLDGFKWAANKWVHYKDFMTPFMRGTLRSMEKSVGTRGCSNDHAHCTDWASIGECDKNPGYMHGSCKLACGLCTPPHVEEL